MSAQNLLEVPPELIRSNPRTLVLDNNQLTELPPEIGQLTNLETLTLNGNQLAELPPEIGQLTNLQTLWLDRNMLAELPPEIGQLTNLRTLWLDSNQLTELPAEIAQLTRLRTIMASGNQLTRLPPGFGQLVGLQELRLDGNQLTEFPPEIGQLTRLRTLWLNGNQLTELPPRIGQLTKLRTLMLANNQLTGLPAAISQLASLRELTLDCNQVTGLPAETGQIASLQHLALKDNQLTELPRELADSLSRGLVLELQGNPLKQPLPDLLGRGVGALATYLRSLEDAIPQYDAKLLLVGEGNVGKTSLIAALINAPFVEDRPTTHGIEIQPLILRHPALDVDMTIRAWDFGGQEVYRISHQFFFSKRALYLVVWNAREGQEQNEVEGWLQRIRLRVSQDARALVIATHSKERQPELDYPRLRQAFPGLLAGRCEVDNKTGDGIAGLRDEIAVEAAQLPQMGQLISPRWIAARDEILARATTDPQIPFEQFVEACRRHEVDGDEISTLAKLMHDLGQIVYYGQDEGLRDFVVLDPEWLTKAISYVLEDEPTRKSKGLLDHARLAEIWKTRPNSPTYRPSDHPYFLRLMEKFDISYRLEDNERRSLVAQLVPLERPDLPWDNRQPPPPGIRALALVCQLGEPVPGLIAWLTVRHHRASTGMNWRSGAFLRHPITAYASEALIELKSPKQLAVDVRAPSPDLYFNVLRDSIEDLITRRWPGLEYRLFIPCPTRADDGYRCHGQFPLDGLLQYREEEAGGSARCWDCGTNHGLSQLLTGFAQPDLPLQSELEQLHERVADVGSGINRLEGEVKRLEGYAAETADSMRRVLRVVGSEITDCPRLFTLTSDQAMGAHRLKFYQRHYRLVLWCEHPGHWHPWAAATYSLHQPKDWLVRVAPYATLVFRALQLVIPVVSSVADVVLTDAQAAQARDELDQMNALLTALPEGATEDKTDLIARGRTAQLNPAQGQALRGIRIVLFEHDHLRAFGDMRRVQAPSGDFLWVCTDHYGEYDPGLPKIPGSEP